MGGALSPQRRSKLGCGRGHLPLLPIARKGTLRPKPLPPLSPFERRGFDHSGPDAAMAVADDLVRNARREFIQMARTPSWATVVPSIPRANEASVGI